MGLRRLKEVLLIIVVQTFSHGSPRLLGSIDSPLATPEGHNTALTLVSDLPTSDEGHQAMRLQFYEHGTFSGKLHGLRDSVNRAGLIPRPPPYEEEGHLHPSSDLHCWSWLDCPNGLQVTVTSDLSSLSDSSLTGVYAPKGSH
jgi:hypothetical protein